MRNKLTTRIVVAASLITVLAGCGEVNSKGQSISKLDRGIKCINGYERRYAGKGYITVFDEDRLPVRCSMEEVN